MAEEVVLMKGNEAIAHAAIRCGADGYFGYPITPQSEVLETLAELKPWGNYRYGSATGSKVKWQLLIWCTAVPEVERWY